MSAPTFTYNFYRTTVPVLRKTCACAISILRKAQAEQAAGGRPSDAEILELRIGDMLPFHKQPILMTKWATSAIDFMKVSQSAPPSTSPDFKTLDDVIAFFQDADKVFETVDEQQFNHAAEKACEVTVAPTVPPVRMTAFADYMDGFVIPSVWFHLNVMYMVLRNAGFDLGKMVYMNHFTSDQLKADWAKMKR